VSGQVSDEAFAKHLIQTRLVTTLQVDTARQEQAELAKQGVAASLADLLIKQGVITPAIRDNIENAVQARQAGGIQRLGQFKLLKKLGEGGMGAVYYVVNPRLRSQAAVEILPFGGTDFPVGRRGHLAEKHAETVEHFFTKARAGLGAVRGPASPCVHRG